jgi:hypothetical protein
MVGTGEWDVQTRRDSPLGVGWGLGRALGGWVWAGCAACGGGRLARRCIAQAQAAARSGSWAGLLRVCADLRVCARLLPQGVYPAHPREDRLVMRLPDPVRVWKSKRERCYLI